VIAKQSAGTDHGRRPFNLLVFKPDKVTARPTPLTGEPSKVSRNAASAKEKSGNISKGGNHLNHIQLVSIVADSLDEPKKLEAVKQVVAEMHLTLPVLPDRAPGQSLRRTLCDRTHATDPGRSRWSRSTDRPCSLRLEHRPASLHERSQAVRGRRRGSAGVDAAGAPPARSTPDIVARRRSRCRRPGRRLGFARLCTALHAHLA
jgi:hypothetical protein